MSKYADSRVYKLEIGEDIYVGSTKTSLSTRVVNHKSAFKKGKMKQQKLYDAINAMPNKFNDVKPSIIEQVSCETKEQLLARERFWIEQLKPSLNMVKFLNKTKEDKQQWEHEYRQNLEVKAKKAERDRRYREKQGEVLLQKKREYNKTHKKKPLTQEQKDEKNVKRREKVECPHCKASFAQAYMSRHVRREHPDEPSTSHS